MARDAGAGTQSGVACLSETLETETGSLPGRDIAVAGVNSQPGALQLLSQRRQSPMAFPQPGNEVVPRRFFPQFPVDVPHPGQAITRPPVVFPAAALDQNLRLLQVDVDGGVGMRLRSGLRHPDQLLSLLGETALPLPHRSQGQVDVALLQVNVGEQIVPSGGGPLGQKVRTQFPPDASCRDSSLTS